MGTVSRGDTSARAEAIERVRALLDSTFARFGYAHVPEPHLDINDQRLLIREFSRLLLRSEELLQRADSRPKLARALTELLAAAKAKVATDHAWANEYAQVRRDEDDDVLSGAARSAPAEWRDL